MATISQKSVICKLKVYVGGLTILAKYGTIYLS